MNRLMQQQQQAPVDFWFKSPDGQLLLRAALLVIPLPEEAEDPGTSMFIEPMGGGVEFSPEKPKKNLSAERKKKGDSLGSAWKERRRNMEIVASRGLYSRRHSIPCRTASRSAQIRPSTASARRFCRTGSCHGAHFTPSWASQKVSWSK
jgi:hypothetical protein